ncbi:hypothetical protein ACTJI8_05960 [Microbacterium sp. 22303]|uniref:hypothetical protein n=1 Tax=Microbacterium sp. 22303 TaxID=3453905 RepID=UPI003F8543EB
MSATALADRSYPAWLEPASGIGAASLWSVPVGSEGYHPYLALMYRVRGEIFHRVWARRPGSTGEARYAFVGDTSVSFPGVVPPELPRIAVSALQLSQAIRVHESRRRIRATPAAMPASLTGG